MSENQNGPFGGRTFRHVANPSDSQAIGRSRVADVCCDLHDIDEERNGFCG